MRLWERLPVGRVIRLAGASPAALGLTIASPPPGAPAIVIYRPHSADSARAVVHAALGELESVAVGLFPAWLPDATGIAGPGGAGVAAVRALAMHVAPQTAQFGPFLADLAESALRGVPFASERFAAEVRAAGLARVIARSYGRPAAALLVHVPDGLTGDSEQALVGGMEWLAQRGGFGVWLAGADLSTADWIATVKVRLPEAVASIERAVATNRTPPPPDLPAVTYPPIAGRPHPQSRVELALEAALRTLPWAVGRAWNQVYQTRPLEPPVRLDLLWREERCVVEIDGPEHADPVRYEADRRRDVQLHLDGYVVLRFTNDQVTRDRALVIGQIEQFIQARRRAMAEGRQMPDKDDLTPTESAIMVVLMAEARDISNKDLEERFGFTLTGKSREKLNRLDLVESWKDGRSFAHRLGEAGWARCANPLNFDGARPRAFGAALGSLLSAVHRDLQRTHRSLAMAFAPDDGGGITAPSALVALQNRIREAYQALASGPRAWVSIADIRRKLSDAGPDEVDAALRALERAPDVNIVPQSNQKALSPEDERAAVTIGGQRKHFLAIGV